MSAAHPAGSVIDHGYCNSVFERPWWLDAVAPGSWGEVLVRREGEVAARLPYVLGTRLGRPVIVQPPLTQRLGPWLRPTEGKAATRMSAEVELLEELIAGLPPVEHVYQQLSPTLTNWLPFHWRGFTAAPFTTYLLDDLSDLDAVWAGLKSEVRGEVRRAGRRFTVSTDHDVEILLDLNRATFRRQGLEPPYDDDLVRRLDAALAARDARRLFVAVDADGRPQAATYLVWGEGCAHYLMGGQSDGGRGSGAPSLLMWEAIRFAATVVPCFDFEGSMLPAVERFVRSFGGRQVPYLAVSRASRRYRRLQAVRGLLRPDRAGAFELAAAALVLTV